MTLNNELKKTYFQTFLKSELTNTKEAIADYIEPCKFLHVHKDKFKKLFIQRLTITIQDNAIMKRQMYGAMCKLKNGINIYYMNKNEKVNITNEEFPIKTNSDWLFYSCKTELSKFNDNHNFYKITFDFTNQMGMNLVLDYNDSFVIELNDDFTNLEAQLFNIEGFTYRI